MLVINVRFGMNIMQKGIRKENRKLSERSDSQSDQSFELWLLPFFPGILYAWFYQIVKPTRAQYFSFFLSFFSFLLLYSKFSQSRTRHSVLLALVESGIRFLFFFPLALKTVRLASETKALLGFWYGASVSSAAIGESFHRDRGSARPDVVIRAEDHLSTILPKFSPINWILS